MEKPIPTAEGLYDYTALNDYIEWKYELRLNDFYGVGLASPFQRYQKSTGDMAPFNGAYPDAPGNQYRVYRKVGRNSRMVKATKQEYDADFKLVHAHYQRFLQWSAKNKLPDGHDFSEWVDQVNGGVQKGDQGWIPLNPGEEVVKTAPKWVKDILRLFRKEFLTEEEEDGNLDCVFTW